MPKSLPYHDFLISQLKDPEYAALYLETHLELDDGEEPDPRLLELALRNVAEALAEQKMSPEQAKIHLGKLEEILFQPLNIAIYQLASWLQELGLKITVTVAKKPENNNTNTEIESEVTVQ